MSEDKSATPRTDQYLAEQPQGFGLAVFCRMLERELADCRRELERERQMSLRAYNEVSRLASHAESAASDGMAYSYTESGVADRLETHLREAPFNDNGTQLFNTATAATMKEAIILLRSRPAQGDGKYDPLGNSTTLDEGLDEQEELQSRKD